MVPARYSGGSPRRRLLGDGVVAAREREDDNSGGRYDQHRDGRKTGRRA